VRLTVVGCSGSTSGPESPASCYLVQAPHEGRTFSLVLDLGPGSFGALYRYVDPRAVDAYALSHLHPDHCLDLCGAYVAGKYSVPGQEWAAPAVYAPAGAGDRIAQAYDTPARRGDSREPGASIGAWFGFRTWQPEQQIGPFRVATTEVDHPVEAYALRVTETGGDGGSLVYSGDTGPCEALVELARGEDGSGVDLLLVESAFLAVNDNPAGIHLTGAEAAEIGERAGVSQVVLTHIPPWHVPEEVLTEATPHFSGPTSLAVTGRVWTIGAE
jgi:ribonuclease BN (tRNA processing enzyme)